MSVDPKSIKTAIELNLEIIRADNITWEMTVVNIEDGLAVNIAGASMTFSVKEKIGDATVLITKTDSSGIVIDGDQATNTGKFQLSLMPADTDNLDPGTYKFDIEIILSTRTGTIARGDLEILGDYTRH